MITASEIMKDIGGGIINIPVWAYNSSTGTWQIYINSVLLNNGCMYTDGNANEITFKVFLAKGTYTLKVLDQKDLNRGIIQVNLNATQIASFDSYNATGVVNYVHTQTNIVVATSGIQELQFKVNGKNASSSGYLMTLIGASLYRTA